MRSHIAIARLFGREKRRHAYAAALQVLLLCCTSLLPAGAAAHPAAAESPVFLDSPCVVVVDKREQDHLDISYAVPMDDTGIAAGDIPVSDAKTHQFFALSGTLYQIGIDDILVPFTEAEGNGTRSEKAGGDVEDRAADENAHPVGLGEPHLGAL